MDNQVSEWISLLEPTASISLYYHLGCLVLTPRMWSLQLGCSQQLWVGALLFSLLFFPSSTWKAETLYVSYPSKSHLSLCGFILLNGNTFQTVPSTPLPHSCFGIMQVKGQLFPAVWAPVLSAPSLRRAKLAALCQYMNHIGNYDECELK